MKRDLMNQRFGELRSLAALLVAELVSVESNIPANSLTTWRKLVKELRRWPKKAVEQLAVPYLRDLLRQHDAKLRMRVSSLDGHANLSCMPLLADELYEEGYECCSQISDAMRRAHEFGRPLCLSWQYPSADLAELFSRPEAEAVTALYLTMYEYEFGEDYNVFRAKPNECLEALAQATCLSQLQSLSIYAVKISFEFVEAMLRKHPRLDKLWLSADEMEQMLVALCQCPQVGQLTSLSLSGRAPVQRVKEFIASPYVHRLRELNITWDFGGPSHTDPSYVHRLREEPMTCHSSYPSHPNPVRYEEYTKEHTKESDEVRALIDALLERNRRRA
jgi:hypothetical protein